MKQALFSWIDQYLMFMKWRNLYSMNFSCARFLSPIFSHIRQPYCMITGKNCFAAFNLLALSHYCRFWRFEGDSNDSGDPPSSHPWDEDACVSFLGWCWYGWSLSRSFPWRLVRLNIIILHFLIMCNISWYYCNDVHYLFSSLFCTLLSYFACISCPKIFKNVCSINVKSVIVKI